MTCEWVVPPAADELSDGELADALTAGAREECWGDRAAVGLIVEHGGWLGQVELRQAVEVMVTPHGELMAWVDWDRVDPAGSGMPLWEERLLALACLLRGVACDRPLSELSCGLAVAGIARVLDAMSVAAFP